MNGHIDADGIAAYRVGLITGRHGSLIAAHLATCAKCASVSDRLAEVSLLLAAAPPPVMPDAVAERLRAAIEAESPISSEQTVVTPARPRFRLPRLSPLRVLAPAAALVVLAAGAFGLSRLGSSSIPAPSAASAGSTARPSPMEGSFATGHADEGLAIGVDGPLMVASTGTDLQADTLGKQLDSLFKSRTDLRTTPASSSIEACVSKVTASRPVLVISALYHGAPATVVIVSDKGVYQGLVAGPHCSATSSDILATAVLPSGISTP